MWEARRARSLFSGQGVEAHARRVAFAAGMAIASRKFRVRRRALGSREDPQCPPSSWHRRLRRRPPLDIQVALRPGADRSPARDRARRRHARLCDRVENPQRCLPQADLDDRRADRVLRGRARHRRRRRPQEGGPRRRQGAHLFRGDDDCRAHPRHRARLRRRARKRHEHRHLDPRCQCPQYLCGQCPQAQGRRSRQLHPQHHSDHLVRRAGAQRRAAGAVFRHPVRGRRWRWWAARRAPR